jgi:uncharacterized membrane protein YgcG
MHGLDFSTWQGILAPLAGLAMITIIGVGVRLLVMATIQQKRERENRQINERLKTLMAAYKTLGGSFTGDLSVDPTHLRDLRRRAAAEADKGTDLDEGSSSDRTRRMRDSVEAALSDIILLGTEELVRLATRAAQELVAGRPVHTAELVVALRAFIRQALRLDPLPGGLDVPSQGPTRPSGGRGRGDGDESRSGGRSRAGGGGGGAGGGGMAMGAGGMGLGAGTLAGSTATADGEPPER